MRILVCFIFLIVHSNLFAQYVMSNQTVYDCDGVLTDSEANTLNPGWYTNNENFSFTICPQGVSSIIIDFVSFMTEPNNDYVTIFSGPDTTYPILAGPYSGINLPPQIITNGCITIQFVSDINVTSEGFELNWYSQISAPSTPVISIPTLPSCSATVINFDLDMNIHCDSVSTAQISLHGPINQNIVASPINCINDSTNSIELLLNPGLNASGIYEITLESYFLDDCDSLWDLSTNYQFIIDDCPLMVDLVLSDDSTICFGDCIDIYANVSGGDSNSYSYLWNPPLPNNAGPHTVCPSINTVYSVIVSDLGPASDQIDSLEIIVNSLPVLQPPFSICQTDSPIYLVANPIGGFWSGSGIIDNVSGLFNPSILASGNNLVFYEFAGCEQSLDVTILEVFAGDDISVCVGAQNFNLNSSSTTIGGVWSGSTYIQSNGDFTVPNVPTTVLATYTLPNGCQDTLEISVVNNINMPNPVTYCQKSGYYPLTVQPNNGVWSVSPTNTQIPSLCPSSVTSFPYQQGWETGLNDWVNDVNNDFDWIVNSGSTPSGGTGPNNAYEDLQYIYAEASNPNNPSKRASIISPCFNLSEYDNPVLHFWYHKYGNGQGSLAVDISADNGLTWNWNHWDAYGDLGDQWNQIAIDLSMFNSSEVLIRIRVVTGNNYKSDVAIDKLSLLSGPITSNGVFISNVANSGAHNITYSIEGCSESITVQVNEIDAGVDYIVCPVENPFNLSGSPSGGLWSGLGVTNNILGTYDPSINLGVNIITYSFNSCVDTALINVVDTDIQIDSLTFCVNSGSIDFDMSLVPRVPWNGVWSGNGIVNSNFPGTFNPQVAEPGIHIINYSANTCSDDLIIEVLPRSQNLDTLICSSSPDILLNVNPTGGYWNGNGIIDNNTGLFSPSQVGVGIHYVQYTSDDNCVDTFMIEVYSSPILSISGLDSDYCFLDTLILISTTPSTGGVLSGSGVVGNYFNPSIAGEGYHIISYTYGSGDCLQSINSQVFIGEKLDISTYFSNDSICVGDIIVIGANASGGNGTYYFDWNNNLSSSFEHLVEPLYTSEYIVTLSDNCSDDAVDTIPVFVYNDFNIDFTVSMKKCYGEKGFAKVIPLATGSYSYLWNNGSILDSIYDFVNKNYNVIVTDDITGCSLEDTIKIPGYENILAYFTPNPTECISLLDGEFQFINNSTVVSNDMSIDSYWDFGDNTIINFYNNESPTHTYLDTGNFDVKLYLENIAGCKDSLVHTVCVIADNKLYIPNSFTPNFDNCNDVFYVKGLGGFEDFNIQVYSRWGDLIFESNDIIITNAIAEGNICNNINSTDLYYKMGTWDGVMNNGNMASTGVYSYVLRYKQSSSTKTIENKGAIKLIR